MTRFALYILAGIGIALTGCNQEASAPEPAGLSRAAIGHYCNMIVADHPGPKIQIHEKGHSQPKWFSSVRDGLAYLTLPGEAGKVVAVYVHDMGRAMSWQRPQDNGIWIEAKNAIYVINSKKRGGMGAKETVPFLNRDQAEAFVREHGGMVMGFEQIPQNYILGDKDEHAPAGGHQTGHGSHDS